MLFWHGETGISQMLLCSLEEMGSPCCITLQTSNLPALKGWWQMWWLEAVWGTVFSIFGETRRDINKTSTLDFQRTHHQFCYDTEIHHHFYDNDVEVYFHLCFISNSKLSLISHKAFRYLVRCKPTLFAFWCKALHCQLDYSWSSG